MKIQIKRGTTSKLVRVFVQDSGQSDGRGLTGLAQNAAGFVAYYIREGDASPTVIAKSAGTVGTWSSGGWAEIDATNMPGLYEFGLPNTVLAGGASVVVLLKGAAGMVPVPLEIQLVAFDTEDATALGLSRLDAAISTRLATAGYTAPDNATIATRATQASVDTVAGYLDTEVAAIKAKTDNLPASPAAVGSAMTLDLTQAIPSSTTVATVGRALLGMEAQALGKWTIVGTTLTLYRQDGTTVVRAFTLDSGTAPTQRS